MLQVGAEALGAKALGMKRYLLRLRVLRALVPSQQSQSAQTQMFLSQAFLAQGQSGQSPSSKGRVSMYLSQAWQALDLSERLLLPAARLLLLLGILALERLVQLRSRVRQMFLSLECKVTQMLETLPFQQMQTYLSRVFRERER
jgi:hypothetical protein